MSELTETLREKDEEVVFDITPNEMPIMRWMVIIVGITQLALGYTSYHNGRWIPILGIPSASIHLVIGFLAVAVFVSFKRLSKKTLIFKPDAIVFGTSVFNYKIQMDGVNRIRLERMRITLERERRPFHLDFSFFSYEKNKVLKPAIISYLREQADRRSIPFVET
jgi:hypothetical protein